MYMILETGTCKYKKRDEKDTWLVLQGLNSCVYYSTIICIWYVTHVNEVWELTQN
jgi:hypothetical protein